jgi:hypothetical protein
MGLPKRCVYWIISWNHWARRFSSCKSIEERRLRLTENDFVLLPVLLSFQKRQKFTDNDFNFLNQDRITVLARLHPRQSKENQWKLWNSTEYSEYIIKTIWLHQTLDLSKEKNSIWHSYLLATLLYRSQVIFVGGWQTDTATLWFRTRKQWCFRWF